MKPVSVIVLSLLAMAVAACTPQRRLARLATSHPNTAAEVCGRMFPVKQSSRVEIRTVKGDTVRIPGQTRYVDCDSVVADVAAGNAKTAYVYVKCPDQTHVTDTIYRDSIVVQENTAEVVAARAKATETREEAAKFKGQRDIYLWALLILAAYTVIRIVLRLWLKLKFP